jgi:hypothetical protein
VLLSQSRKGAGAGILKFRLWLSAPDQKSELSPYSYPKVMQNLLFYLKAVKTGTHKAYVGAGAGAKKIVSAPQHCQEDKM